MTGSMRVNCAVMVLIAWLSGSCGGGYSYPKDQHIDCQPIVSPDRADLCSAPYRQFVETHCPGVGYSD